MSDPLIRNINNFVILEPGKPEEFLSKNETLTWLENWLQKIDQLPKDIKSQPSLSSAAKHLLDTACDLEISPGIKIQWFAVRINPPKT